MQRRSILPASFPSIQATVASLGAVLLSACSASNAAPRRAPLDLVPPIPGAVRMDELIEPGETHFKALFQVARSGENAEAYWSFGGDRLTLQRRDPSAGVDCDRIYLTDPVTGRLDQVSNGKGVTTCSFFMPGDTGVVFASTHGAMEGCPPPPDRSEGYVWVLHPEYEIYVHDLESGELTQLTDSPGYDAEAVVSPRGDRMVFTSVRSGDPELFTCDLDGGNLVQVTNESGYDGGAFFSHSGERLVYRRTWFDPENEFDERDEFARLLADNKVRPGAMEIWTIAPDGSDAQQVTQLGGANWAPYFTPDDQRILFSTNHHVTGRSRNFDIFSVPANDGPHAVDAAQPITTYEGFDSFPMFSPDGKWLAFSSNRGGDEEAGETIVYVALWED